MHILDQILETKRQELKAAKAELSEAALSAQLNYLPPIRDFVGALRARANQQQSAVIAEVKKASPSKGIIREDFHPVTIANDYDQYGATCLSVLTDQQYFKGEDDFLVAVRETVELPLLRKDFMIDPYQILQSRVLGGDCVLLIAAALDDALMADCYEAARDLGLHVLVEVHNHAELERAMRLELDLVGINNRDLRTFDTSLNTTIELAREIPESVMIVTESGIKTKDDIALMHAHNIYAFLVGETFMRAEKPGPTMNALFDLPTRQN